MNCCAAVFRAARAGRCAVAAKPTDPPERITAVSARGAYGAWTTTVPGENAPSSVRRPATPHLYSLILHLQHLLICGFLMCVIFRINNCVGELNQKYFIQFLFYTGEHTIHTACRNDDFLGNTQFSHAGGLHKKTDKSQLWVCCPKWKCECGELLLLLSPQFEK